MFVIYTKNIRFFYKEAKVKPHDILYINAKHAIVSDEGEDNRGFVRLFDERGEQIFAGCLEYNPPGAGAILQRGVNLALRGEIARFTDISAEEV